MRKMNAVKKTISRKGLRIGPPLKLSEKKIEMLVKMRLKGKTYAEISERFNISLATTYNYWNKFKPNKLKK